jgi:hypothetical protein
LGGLWPGRRHCARAAVDYSTDTERRPPSACARVAQGTVPRWEMEGDVGLAADSATHRLARPRSALSAACLAPAGADAGDLSRGLRGGTLRPIPGMLALSTGLALVLVASGGDVMSKCPPWG